MVEHIVISRKDALKALKGYGITEEQVYLIDLIPLIEMMWADGLTQRGEIAALENYIERHVEHVNRLAGCQVLSFQAARDFAEQFIEERPSADLMSTLRNFVKPVRLSAADKGDNERLRSSLLAACMDIASCSVTDYPYDFEERFNPDEKACFFSILESLSE
ncbi:MAG: hypothetical protein WGN25_08665 [Candidatus Electrothrix sp. GW3-4]|uniref:hypothetical protein n=1 Tax=Candidatus Electrothrix sp. GW3-4 TaxID=3126740 RepID=UPI0030CABDA1